MDKAQALANAARSKRRRDEAIAEARAQFVAAIAEARQAGASYHEIGVALGMSHVAVMKFAKGAVNTT